MAELPDYVQRNLPYLKGVQSVKDASLSVKRRAINSATDEQLLTIISILYNFYLGNIEVSPEDKPKLRCWKSVLSSVLSKSTGLEQKRVELVKSANCVIVLLDLFLQHE